MSDSIWEKTKAKATEVKNDLNDTAIDAKHGVAKADIQTDPTRTNVNKDVSSKWEDVKAGAEKLKDRFS
eukprot:ANDGO_00835.mRNA.1 hypothetical protein